MIGRLIRDVIQSGAECAYCEDRNYKVFRKRNGPRSCAMSFESNIAAMKMSACIFLCPPTRIQDRKDNIA